MGREEGKKNSNLRYKGEKMAKSPKREKSFSLGRKRGDPTGWRDGQLNMSVEGKGLGKPGLSSGGGTGKRGERSMTVRGRPVWSDVEAGGYF